MIGHNFQGANPLSQKVLPQIREHFSVKIMSGLINLHNSCTHNETALLLQLVEG